MARTTYLPAGSVGEPDKIVTDWWGNKVRLQKLWNDAYNFMRHHHKVGNISQKDFDRIMNSLEGSGEERSLQLDKATYDFSWKDSRGYSKARYPQTERGKISSDNRKAVSTTIKASVKRADDAGEKNSQAHKILRKFKNNPYYPAGADDYGEILDLRTRGVGIEPSVKGRTFRWTPEAGPVPKELRVFENHRDHVN